MNLIDLTTFVENKIDKAIMQAMITETEGKLIQRIGSLMLTYVNAFELNTEEKRDIKYKIEGFIEDSFGGVATYLFLTSIFAEIYEKYDDTERLVNELVITFLRYLLSDIGKGEFVESIWRLSEAIGISNGFYDSLVDYFGKQKKVIVQPILPKIYS